MSLLIFILLVSVILIAINQSIVIALNASNNEPSKGTDFGGLSAESTDIAEANKTDLITGTKNNNSTDFGGLSARSVNITK
jgi:uncharacterized protein YpmB